MCSPEERPPGNGPRELRQAGNPASTRWAGLDREAVVLALICLLALVIRLAYVLTLQPRSFWFDGEQYSRLATGLLDHGSYLNDRGRPSAYWPPGYPLFLAAIYQLFGVNIVAVRVVQCLVGAATVAVVHRIARRVLDRSGAWLAALATALYPMFIYSAGADMPVTLQIALIAGGVLLTLVAVERNSARAALGAGLLGAWATLVAGSALPAFLWFALWMVWSRDGAAGRGHSRNLRLALVCLLPIVLVVGAWTVRNQRAFGRTVLVSTNAGYNLWLGNHPGVKASTGNRAERPGAGEVPGMEAEAARIWALPGNEATRDSAFTRRALEIIAADVPRFLRLSLSKSLELWALYPRPMSEDRPRLSIEKLASLLSYGLLLPFALAWLFVSLPRSRVALLVLVLFLIHSLVHAVILSKVRFRLPLDIFVIIYGCGGIVAAVRALGRRWLAKGSAGH
jgi:4-amino-4-deoxy-L-arabinose transferase-like glycosyltransferase